MSNNNGWVSLDERLPEGQQCVLLFPIISDVGIVYTVSNPDFVRGPFCRKQGYTHWKAFDPHPDEEKQYAYNASLYEDDK